jgi:hypothetical protein
MLLMDSVALPLFAGADKHYGSAIRLPGSFSVSRVGHSLQVPKGAVVPTVQPPPIQNAGNGYYKDVDTILSWPFKYRERVTISPSVAFFNIFNFENFWALSGLTAAGGAINGTVAGISAGSSTVRIGRGSGVFAVGAPIQNPPCGGFARARGRLPRLWRGASTPSAM